MLAATYTYDSFGNLTASTGTIINRYQYTGRELDAETGLYYYRARYYDPVAGRFSSEDPMGFDADINSYTYSYNRATNYVDPSGLAEQRITVPTIKDDENGALNILLYHPGCWEFVSNAINKAFTYLNNEALARGIMASDKTVTLQSKENSLVNFAMTMFEADIDVSNKYPTYGAHVSFPGGSTIHIDLGYEGPVNLIHETLHLAPYGFSDTDMAHALGAPYVVDPRSVQKTIENASSAWNCLLEKACK